LVFDLSIAWKALISTHNLINMNTKLLVRLGIVAVIAILIFALIGSYNGMVRQDQAVKGAWAQVETQYQRRNDLIGNLVNTVAGYAKFEKSTLTEVIQARANATKMTVNAEDLSPEKIEQFQRSQGQLGAALGRLMTVVENYPDLKASQQFTDLQREMTGTENRIATARRDFNEATQDYNSRIRTFPAVLYSGLFGFKEKGYFAAEQGASTAPKVSKDAFDTN
jgi:LemA protein